MGNITSFCCRDGVSVADDQEERARILTNDCASTNSLYNQSSTSGQDDLSYGSVNNLGSGGGVGGGGSKSLEQAALDRIYQKMATNVIDVAPGESMVIQPAEFNERQKAYQTRLNQIKTPLPLRSSPSTKVLRNLNSSMLDSTANTTRINTSISTAGANLTAFNQLNHITTSSGGAGGASSSSNYSISNTTSTTNNHINNTSHLIGASSTLNTTTPSLGGGHSPLHLAKVQEKRRVEYEPISAAEIQLINEISDKTVKAIKGLKVVYNEPVVTCFQP